MYTSDDVIATTNTKFSEKHHGNLSYPNPPFISGCQNYTEFLPEIRQKKAACSEEKPGTS